MPAPNRIASLLPGATETCCALGLGDRLVGVSHECDFPEAVRQLPRLTRSSIDASAPSAEIHRQVGARLTRGLSLYDVLDDRLAALRPELIVTQDTCQVCAVSFDQVAHAARDLVGGDVDIVSLAPTSLDDVLDDIACVADAAGVPARAAGVVASMRARFERVRAAAAGRPRPRVLALEWLDPPMVAGHWTPELIRIAGGDPVLGHDRMPTRAETWDALRAADADVLLAIPCGFGLAQTEREMPALLERVLAPRVVIADGNAYFNRPGPRLADSAEVAFAAIHGELPARGQPWFVVAAPDQTL
jgi:iron complex transport system substrate-binding protein